MYWTLVISDSSTGVSLAKYQHFSECNASHRRWCGPENADVLGKGMEDDVDSELDTMVLVLPTKAPVISSLDLPNDVYLRVEDVGEDRLLSKIICPSVQ